MNFIPQEFHIHNNYPCNPIHRFGICEPESIGLLISEHETLVLFAQQLIPTLSLVNYKYFYQDKHLLFLPLEVHRTLYHDDEVKHIPGKKGEFKVHLFEQYRFIMK